MPSVATGDAPIYSAAETIGAAQPREPLTVLPTAQEMRQLKGKKGKALPAAEPSATEARAAAGKHIMQGRQLHSCDHLWLMLNQQHHVGGVTGASDDVHGRRKWSVCTYQRKPIILASVAAVSLFNIHYTRSTHSSCSVTVACCYCRWWCSG